MQSKSALVSRSNLSFSRSSSISHCNHPFQRVYYTKSEFTVMAIILNCYITTNIKSCHIKISHMYKPCLNSCNIQTSKLLHKKKRLASLRPFPFVCFVFIIVLAPGYIFPPSSDLHRLLSSQKSERLQLPKSRTSRASSAPRLSDWNSMTSFGNGVMSE